MSAGQDDAPLTQAAIARAAGVSCSMVGQVMKGTRTSPRVFAVLRRMLGERKTAELWPASRRAAP